MTIIRHGTPSVVYTIDRHKEYVFNCSNCNCLFKVEEKEVHKEEKVLYAYGIRPIPLKTLIFYPCPECGTLLARTDL